MAICFRDIIVNVKVYYWCVYKSKIRCVGTLRLVESAIVIVFWVTIARKLILNKYFRLQTTYKEWCLLWPIFFVPLISVLSDPKIQYLQVLSLHSCVNQTRSKTEEPILFSLSYSLC